MQDEAQHSPETTTRKLNKQRKEGHQDQAIVSGKCESRTLGCAVFPIDPEPRSDGRHPTRTKEKEETQENCI